MRLQSGDHWNCAEAHHTEAYGRPVQDVNENDHAATAEVAIGSARICSPVAGRLSPRHAEAFKAPLASSQIHRLHTGCHCGRGVSLELAFALWCLWEEWGVPCACFVISPVLEIPQRLAERRETSTKEGLKIGHLSPSRRGRSQDFPWDALNLPSYDDVLPSRSQT